MISLGVKASSCGTTKPGQVQRYRSVTNNTLANVAVYSPLAQDSYSPSFEILKTLGSLHNRAQKDVLFLPSTDSTPESVDAALLRVRVNHTELYFV